MHIMKNILSLFVVSTLLALSVRGADLPADKSADELWKSIKKMEQEPPPQDRAGFLERAGQLYSALSEFERRYPADPRRWDAKLAIQEVASGLAQANDKPTDDAAFFALTKEILAAPDASAETKADARYLVVEKRIELLGAAESVTNGPARAAADAALQEIRQNYPNDERTLQIQLDVADFFKLRDPNAAESILRELTKSKNQKAAALAQQQLGAMTTQRHPAKRRWT